MNNDSEASMNSEFVEMAKLMNIYLNHFPKHEKYSLAQQIRNCMYELYGHIVEGQKRYHKKTTLINIDIKHEQLRMFVNLANNLEYFSFKSGAKDNSVDAHKRFVAINRKIDTLGRMIGGWIRSENAKEDKQKVIREVS